MINPTNLELLVMADYGSEDVLKEINPSIDRIIKVLKGLDWNEFHQVVLSRSDNNWIEVGGNLRSDGLACIYQEEDDVFVIDEAPTSIEQMIEILVSYYNNDGAFKRKYAFSSNKDDERKKEEEEAKYLRWREKYKEELIIEKRKKLKKTILKLIAICISLFVIYNWITGELRFFGQKADYAIAEVLEAEMRHFWHSSYFQRVTYSFDYEGKKYRGTFRAGRGRGLQRIGNKVKVKFSISNPNRSELVAIPLKTDGPPRNKATGGQKPHKQ